jgi:hypothetical protein
MGFSCVVVVVVLLMYVVGGATAAPVGMIDNAAWAREHIRNCDDIQKVFRFVQHAHPYMGMAYPLNAIVSITGDESIDDLALHADVVTVACVQEIARMPFQDFSVEEMNETGVGNIAFIVLHMGGKTQWANKLEEWREYARGWQRVLPTIRFM